MSEPFKLNQNSFLQTQSDNHCNLCGSINSEVITIRRNNILTSLKKLCKECGLVYSDPLPSIKELETYYQQKYDNQFGEIFIPKIRRIYRSALRAIYRYNRIKHYLRKDAKILDTSACMGEFVYLLKEKGYNAIGVEHNKYFIQFARNELKINIEPHFLDNITFENGSFDIITGYHILNLYINPFLLLKKYRRMLKDGGILNIEITNIDARHIAPYHRFRFKYFYNFNLYTISSMARKAGFKVVNTILIPGSMHINMILKKGEESKEEVINKQNYNLVRDAIIGYKSLNFLVSPLPYMKAVNNIKKYITLTNATEDFSSGKEVLDNCFAKIISRK